MNAPNRTTTTKSSGSSGNGGQVLRDAAETASAQTQQAFEKMSAATTDATTLMKDSYSTAAKHTQDYNAKFIQFAQANTEAAFGFFQKLSSVKSPTEFLELSTSHLRKQFEALTEQARELTTLAQKVVSATMERVESDVNKAYSQRS
jgi:phasin